MNCFIPKDTFLDGFIRENAEKARTSARQTALKHLRAFFIIEKAKLTTSRKEKENMSKKTQTVYYDGKLPINPEKIYCLDIEGVPNNIGEITIIQINGERIYHTEGIKGKFPLLKLKEIQEILNQAKMIVGHNLNSDLRTLQRQGAYLYEDIRCVDTFATYQKLKEMNLITAEEDMGGTLGNIARFFHIERTGYHQSEVDAQVTAAVFLAMVSYKQGLMVEVKPSISQIRRIKESEGNGIMTDNNYGNKEEPTMEKPIMPVEEKDEISPKQEYQGIYQWAVTTPGHKVVIRLTKAEYSLFMKIKEINPTYSIKTFYNTIIQPGMFYQIKKQTQNYQTEQEIKNIEIERIKRHAYMEEAEINTDTGFVTYRYTKKE